MSSVVSGPAAAAVDVVAPEAPVTPLPDPPVVGDEVPVGAVVLVELEVDEDDVLVVLGDELPQATSAQPARGIKTIGANARRATAPADGSPAARSRLDRWELRHQTAFMMTPRAVSARVLGPRALHADLSAARELAAVCHGALLKDLSSDTQVNVSWPTGIGYAGATMRSTAEFAQPELEVDEYAVPATQSVQ